MNPLAISSNRTSGISVLLPTFNEREGISELLPRLFASMTRANLIGQAVIIDDCSTDGTADLAESLALKYPIKVLRREGERGLGSAVLYGASMAEYDVVVVMDADLSHPPELVPKLVMPVLQGQTSVVVGSRMVRGGSMGDMPLIRVLGSFLAQFLGRPLVPIQDVTSGFFACQRSALIQESLQVAGFKILLQLLVKGDVKDVMEVPYTFGCRQGGASKFGLQQILEYFTQLVSLYRYRWWSAE